MTFDNTNVVCFAKGTLIKTINGERLIEDLQIGDRVLTMDNGYQRVQWIGGTQVPADTLSENPKLRPIRIRAGALGSGLPASDLTVSRQHRVLVRSTIAIRMFDTDEVLIPAIKLLDIDGIDIVDDLHDVAYFHMLFDHHEIVFSNGAPTESLYTGPEALKSVSPDAQQEIAALFPEILDPDYAPTSARFIPEKGKQMKNLVQRHQKNSKDLLSFS
ncbi:hemolysin [Tateyamaria sp. ANG-S1]|nr:hemolysin [Tateyamaria sp. ANG-S1]